MPGAEGSLSLLKSVFFYFIFYCNNRSLSLAMWLFMLSEFELVLLPSAR